jgi:5-formyltetrahydrofolate cyclo-ligase
MSKADLRRHASKVIGGMSEVAKREASEAICKRLASIASVSFADTIFAYLALADEVDLSPIMKTWIDESRTVGVPLVSWENKTMKAGLLHSLDDKTLEVTRYGLREPSHRHPIPADCIDAILVPGLAFDASGGRLGRGGGFYDRYLDTSRPPIVIGVAFDEQIQGEVPLEPHDERMTVVVTQTRTLLV